MAEGTHFNIFLMSNISFWAPPLGVVNISQLLFVHLGEELSKKQAAQESQIRKLRAQVLN